MVPTRHQKRFDWFHEAKFGMFIHFGLYSLLRRGEWTMFFERIPTSEYTKLAKRFRVSKWNPAKWMQLAVDAGMKYIVLTARHHDGFCLFDSAVSDFSSVHSPVGRDLVAESVQAARKAGLKVGLYYSLADWRYPGFFEPDLYPDSARAMVQQAHEQVRELMSNYGRIDELWYDGGVIWKYGEKDSARFWQSRKLNTMVRQLQPNILINDRSGLKEDFDTPEQKIEPSKQNRAWESCMTIGYLLGWGEIRHDPARKTTGQLIEKLIDAVADGGNFLLNVGPKADGSIRADDARIMREIGRWLRENGEAIYACDTCDLLGGRTPYQLNMLGRWTQKGCTAYLHILRWPGKEATIPLVASKVRKARLLATRQCVSFRQEANRLTFQNLPLRPPNSYATVIAVEFDEPPKRFREKDTAAWLVGKDEVK